MKFFYQARTETGQIQSGVVEATSREAALNLLKSYNLFVTVLKEASLPFYAKRLKFFERIPRREIVLFSRQLAIMFKSEIPLVEILTTLAKQIKNPLMKEKVSEMVDKVEGGMSLSRTFSFYPEIFNDFYINMVKAGETVGKLSEVFSYLADNLEKEYDFNRKIKGAMIYPTFLLIVSFLVIGLVIFFLVPQLTQFYLESGQRPVGMAKVLFGYALFLKEWGWIFILIFLIIVFFSYFYLKTKEGKKTFDKIILKIPLLNILLKNIYLSRIALNLSTLLSGGLPIVQALKVTSDVVGNEIYKSIVSEVEDRVKKGERISVVFEKYPKEIPPLFIQMLVAGEKTGRLDLSLKNIVEFYQKEIEQNLDNFLRLLEPVLIVIFGLVVGGLMASVVLPIYQITSAF